MEPNESHHQQHQHLSPPYYHHHHSLSLHHHHPTTDGTAATAAAVPSSHNGILSPPPPNDGSSLVVYPHSVPSSAMTAPIEPAKRKRGRPRKYGTPEQALAAKRMASSGSGSSARERREHAAAAAGVTTSSNSGSSRKSQSSSVGKTGQSFTPHIVNIAAGEDVAQKIVLFAQQSKHELCVLSASGTISNASLRQPALSGGIVSYEGQYEIVSLCGSYIRAELGGKSGGLSVCLSSSDGQIIGGGVGGHLIAAGPVQVILGTFQLDRKKDASSGVKGDASSSGSRLPSPAGNSLMLGIGFRSGMESSERNPMRGDDHHHQTAMGAHFMIQTPQGVHMTHSRPSEWGTSGHDGRSSAGYDLSGRMGNGPQENRGYEQMPD
ncbi:PREDICTED: AT-hook motif nuclear-localized protein 14-like [Tarenaya hassleriana]|uniref:AT-hook motif nuclear-localized protein 14-like n=1 Tax=Tarenaya hassleriana TaxID=28532 RepID=UPI00053C225D|nr:PREDICTED: AT-hook motif nuclear-localized protein 14-like [Tarenaya hassleriana]